MSRQLQDLDAALERGKEELEKRYPAHNFNWRSSRGSRIFGMCPNPNHHETNPSFNVYVKDGAVRYHCFGCNISGPIEQLDGFTAPKRTVDSVELETTKIDKQFKDEFTPLLLAPESNLKQMTFQYLTRRGVTEEDILTYGLGLGRKAGSDFFSFIGLPYYDLDGRVQFFCGRSFVGSSLRYKFPTCEKMARVGTYMTQEYERLVLVEGAFDGINTHKAGFCTMVLFGKYIADAHLQFIIKSGFKEVIVFLDKDAVADGMKLANSVQTATCVKTKAICPTAKDPGEMQPDAIRSLLLNGHALGFSDKIRMLTRGEYKEPT